MPFKDKIKRRKYHKNYEKVYFKKYPWKKHLKESKSRCNNPKRTGHKYYYDKGIKCLITEEEIKELWFRDKAYLLKKPSIDRIDNDGDYTFDNCQFIEMIINTSKINKRKKILQYDLEGNFLQEWESIISIELILGIDHRQICNTLKEKQKTCHGYIWKYKSENP